MSRLRSVVVRLKAEVNDFKAQMSQAAKAAEDVGKKSQQSTTQTSTAMGQLRTSLRENRAEWDEIGNKALIAGGAMTAVTAAVLKTGISYNTLQQTSRAALTTMLGGAEAANAQMDKLDEFARSSPFAKQVFIDAQRQLIGFGMEAERVIPTLDAIQNAVAATGGSNQDIAELVRIIAQVGAAGKITATDLMQFGQRGVDAATLIGSQMGKTGAQIREEITAGTLGADEAIQALTDGMQERFGGAAEGVKNTFAGAMDRVKAAIRDIASEFASAFVDPQGGGLLIDWTNQLADVLRAFQRLPDPIKNTAGAIFALSGVALLTVGSLIKLGGSAYDAWTSFQKLRDAVPAVDRAFGSAGAWAATAAAIAAVGAAVGKIQSASLPAIAGVEDLRAALIDLAQAGDSTSLDRIFYDLGEQAGWSRVLIGQMALDVDNLGQALDRIDNKTWLQSISDINDGIQRFFGMTPEVDQATAAFSALSDALVKTAQTAGAEVAAEQFRALVDELGGGEEAVQRLLAVMPSYAAYLKETDNGQRQAAGSAGEHAAALAEQEAAAEAAAEAQLTLAEAVVAAAEAVMGAASAEIAVEQSYRKTTEALKKNGAAYVEVTDALGNTTRAIDRNTDAGNDNELMLIRFAQQSQAAAKQQLEMGRDVSEVSGYLSTQRERFIEMATAALGGGDDAARAARLMADEYGLTTGTVHALSQSIKDVPSKHRTDFATNAAAIQAQVQNLQRAINNLRGKTVIIATQFSGPGAQYVRPGTIGINADGGMWDKSRVGLVRAYAGGGFFDGRIGDQQPQARPYAGPKGLLWSEEGSGPWEAFISGHPAKADRSRTIWLDVGRRLGMIAAHANGGLQEYARAARYAGPVARQMGATAGGTMRIEGVLDTPFGPSAVRGVVRSEMTDMVRSAGGF